MTTQNSSFAETTIVAFHISRGGQFNNPGHLKYIGENKIGHFADDLFPRYDNEQNFSKRFGFDQTNDKDQKCILDLITVEAFDELEEKFGITQKMLGEERYYDAAGHDTGLTANDVLCGIGRIKIDGIYNTTYACYLKDCNEKELQAIVEKGGSFDDAIGNYAKAQLGIDETETEQ